MLHVIAYHCFWLYFSHSDHPFPSVKGRNFLSLKDFTSDEIHYLLWVAADLKARYKEKSYLDEVRTMYISRVW